MSNPYHVNNNNNNNNYTVSLFTNTQHHNMAASDTSHRDVASLFHSREKFPSPWIGDEPQIGQRRAYMLAYFDWLQPDEVHRNEELRQHAFETAASAFFEKGYVSVFQKDFEWVVDRMVWMCFFERRRPNSPIFPWASPRDTGRLEAKSVAYQDWKVAHVRQQRDPECDKTTPQPDAPQPDAIMEESPELGPKDTLYVERRAYIEVIRQLHLLRDEQPHVFDNLVPYEALKGRVNKLISKTGTDSDPLLRLEEIQVNTAIPDMEKIGLRNEVEELTNKVSTLELDYRILQKDKESLENTVRSLSQKVSMASAERDARWASRPMSPPTPSRPVRVKRRRVVSDGGEVWGKPTGLDFEREDAVKDERGRM